MVPWWMEKTPNHMGSKKRMSGEGEERQNKKIGIRGTGGRGRPRRNKLWRKGEEPCRQEADLCVTTSSKSKERG